MRIFDKVKENKDDDNLVYHTVFIFSIRKKINYIIILQKYQ